MKTLSRYDYMSEGSVTDEVSKSAYPDPLSLNYLNFNLTSTPIKNVMTDSKIIYFWKEAENIYGVAKWDDIVLTINNIPHKNFLNPKDVIYFPTLSDIQSSFTKTR